MNGNRYAVDTSVAVPLLLRTHQAHTAVSVWSADKTLCLCGHAAAETFSVLTRLPLNVRASGDEVARVIDESFAEVVPLSPKVASSIHRELASCGISGGAVYDALVAFAAREHGLTLVTRDLRAKGTYEAVGIRSLVLVG